jgi:hypothetical protein
MKKTYLAFLALSVVSTLNLVAVDQPSLNPHLEPFRPLLGKTWKGVFKNSKPDKPVVDIARWERALNGQAVRLLHSINQGVYGGETIFTWNEKEQKVVFHYFTTAGFTTSGSVQTKEGKLLTHEIVAGSSGGVTEVRATSEIRSDGKLHVKSEHLKNGQWEPGHEVTYEVDAASEVIFK